MEHPQDASPVLSSSKRHVHPSFNGGSLDLPFLNHLCDMSLRFPEPPVGPPLGAKAFAR